MCENSTSFEFLNVRSPTYLPYQTNASSNQAKSNDALNPKCMPCDDLIDKFAFWPFKFTSTKKDTMQYHQSIIIVGQSRTILAS